MAIDGALKLGRGTTEAAGDDHYGVLLIAAATGVFASIIASP